MAHSSVASHTHHDISGEGNTSITPIGPRGTLSRRAGTQPGQGAGSAGCAEQEFVWTCDNFPKSDPAPRVFPRLSGVGHPRGTALTGDTPSEFAREEVRSPPLSRTP